MQINKKKILILGGQTKHIVEIAQQMGLYVVVTSNQNKGDGKAIADETLMISTTDLDALEKYVKENNISGVFSGPSEFHLFNVMQLCERVNLPFYATVKQWNTCTNKNAFKKLCREYSVPVIPEYHVSEDLTKEDLTKILYPVLVKPADGSSGLGISICYSEEELLGSYQRAKQYSKTNEVIVEQYMEGLVDIDVYYTIQNGYYSVSAMVNRHLTYEQGRLTPLPIGYDYQSEYLDCFLETQNNKIIRMFKSIGIENGVLDIGGFTDGSSFYFYETSYRIWGSHPQIFIEKNNTINPIKMMINYALTGEMSGWDVKQLDNPKFKNPCCQMLFPVKPGKIGQIIGLDYIKRIPEVIYIYKMREEGEEVELTGSLVQLCVRIYVCAKNTDRLRDVVNEVNNNLMIISDKGIDMRMNHFVYPVK